MVKEIIMGQNKRILGFGDSILKGVLRENEHYSICDSPFMSQIGEMLDVETANYGRFGCTISTGKTIIGKHLKDISKSKYTLLEYGGNDCDFNWPEIAKNPSAIHNPNTGIQEFAMCYKSIIDDVRFAGSEPILLSLPPIDSSKFYRHISKDMDETGRNNIMSWLKGSIEAIGNWHELYNLEIFKMGIALKVQVVDITSSFLAQFHIEDYLCEDGIHPNQEGQRLIANCLCGYFANA